MDPLSVLRDFTIRNNLNAITHSGDAYHFTATAADTDTDTYSFPASAETAFRSKQGTPYSLQTLIFFIRNHTQKHTDYIQSSRLHHIPPVTLPDRKPLLDYLTGRISSSDSIDHVPAVHPYHPDNPSLSLPLPPPPPPLDDIALLRSRERPLKDRDSILECRNRDFYSVIVASTRREEERNRVELLQRKDEIVAKTRHVEIGEGVPIILVPSAFQTLITIYNVREFLEDGVFVPPDGRARETKGGGRPECVTVQKKLSRDRVVAAYEVRDKTTGFKGEDWERVVAVFVLGKEWQFKDWPFRDHVEIFNKSEFVLHF